MGSRVLLFLTVVIGANSYFWNIPRNQGPDKKAITYLDEFPFRNVSLPWDVRVDDLVNRLTAHEMVLQMARGGSSPWSGPAPSIPRLGIGSYVWNTECLRGDVATLENATAFPQAIGLAASFSPELVHRVAIATGREVRGKHNDFAHRGIYASLTGTSCFSPVINIVRDPRWGRIQETYGEDIFLTGKLTEAFVTGLQGNHSRYVLASAGCKHFDAYAGPEHKRAQFDAKVSEYDLRNTFLPAFKKCVDAGTYSLMCSYNSINGVPACANRKLLTDILRSEWGFKGYVVSDDTAIQQVFTVKRYVSSKTDAAAVCANAGTNLELSAGLQHQVYQLLDEAYEQGKITLELLRERVKPLFYTRMRLGEFDPPEMNPYTYKDLNNSAVETKEHQHLAVEAAMKSFVLLKNKGHVLPLKPQDYKNVAVVGPMAERDVHGDYSPQTSSFFKSDALDGIRKIFNKTRFHKTCDDGPTCKEYNSSVVPKLVKDADLVFVTLGTDKVVESEALDRKDLDLPGQQKQLLLDVLNYSPADAKIVLLLFNAGPLNVTFADGHDRVHAIMECFFPAQATGIALFNVLTNQGGSSSPAGRLPVTWPLLASEIPSIKNYSMKGRTYRYYESSPLYPFGYGLSYTSFHYDVLQVPRAVSPTSELNATLALTNTGLLDADEVIQCYISWVNQTLPVPKLQMAYVNRVHMRSEEQKKLNLVISPEAWTVWVNGSWVVFEGKMELFCGGQQPNQVKKAPSNIVSSTFNISSGAISKSPFVLNN